MRCNMEKMLLNFSIFLNVCLLYLPNPCTAGTVLLHLWERGWGESGWGTCGVKGRQMPGALGQSSTQHTELF